VIGVSIVAFSLFMGRQDAVQLVQRSRTPAVELSVAVKQSTQPAPTGIAAKHVAEPVVNVPTPPSSSASLPIPAAPRDVAAPRLEAAAPVITAAVKLPTPHPHPLPHAGEGANHSRSSPQAGDVNHSRSSPQAVDVNHSRGSPQAVDVNHSRGSLQAVDVNDSLSRSRERAGVRASAIFAPAPPKRPAPEPIEAASTPTIRLARTEPPPAPPQARAPEAAPPAAPITTAVYVPLPAPPPRHAPVPGVSLAEVQPLLSQLLQHLESGRGERLIDLLDREARSKSGAQALSQQYDGLVDGKKPVRLSHVEFKSEPADGRLLVTGHVRLQVGEQTIGTMGKKMVLRAEFALRQGTVVMTGLSGALGND
jgi:hypothetical protein